MILDPAPCRRGLVGCWLRTLDRFAKEEPKKAELVKLRYFAGLTLEQAAQDLGLPEGTAKRWWTYSRAWLFRELSQD